MEDLAALKGELKSWEKTFQFTHGRPPGKDDIKRDQVIAQKYKIYNKSRNPPASSTSAARAEVPARTTRPPPFASSSASTSATSASSKPRANGSLSSETMPPPPTTPSKAKSKDVDPSPPSAGRRTIASKNPFLASPAKTVPLFQSPSKTALPPHSPSFHFPSSPARLRSLISAHSSTGSPNDAEGIKSANGAGRAGGWTPRTKARKRLRGESTGDTPQKAPRRSYRPAKTEEEEEEESRGALTVMEEDEDILGPSPLKPDDLTARRRFQLESDDEGESSDEDLPSIAGADVKGKGKASRSKLPASFSSSTSAKPKALFGAGKIIDPASLKDSSNFSSAAASTLPASKRNNPFLFSTTEAWDREPPRPIDPTAAAAEDAAASKSKKSTGKKKNARLAAESDEDEETEGGPSAKKARKRPAAPRMSAAAKLKAEETKKKLEDLLDGDEEMEEADGRRDASDSDGEVTIVRSHGLLGRGRDSRRGAAAQSPLKRQALDKEDADAAFDGDATDENGADVDVAAAGWNSDEEGDILGLNIPSPAKPPRSRGLFGLPAHLSTQPSSPLAVEASNSLEQPPIPRHLLSILSLRSPEHDAAKLAKRRDAAFHAIFASSSTASDGATFDAPSQAARNDSSLPVHHTSAPFGSKKGKGRAAPSSAAPPPAVDNVPRWQRKRILGEVWGAGDADEAGMLGGGEASGDDDWASETEGWKEGGGLRDDEEDW